MSETIPNKSETILNKPEMKTGLNRYEFTWAEHKITALCDRVNDDGTGELAVYHENGSGKEILLYTNINLLSANTCTQIAKRLSHNLPTVNCDTLLTYITQLTMQELRRGEPPVRIGTKPAVMKHEYLLRPILQKGKSTTLYAPGGSVKSYLADLIAVLIQCNVAGMDGLWIPEAGNVLYLDWEACKEDHERRVWAIKLGLIKQGVKVSLDDTFIYSFQKEPLTNNLYAIQKLVSDNNIVLTIIDSHMAAQGYGPDQAQVASEFYNALRCLNCTTLTIDHVDKASWRGESEAVGPYGSVVKYNRSRAQFELIKQQNSDEDHVELALKHRKNNEGKLLPTIGIRVDFVNNHLLDLDYVQFSPCNISDNPELSKKTQSLKQRLVHELESQSLTVKELHQILENGESTIRMELNRNKNIFTKLPDDTWGVLSDKTV